MIPDKTLPETPSGWTREDKVNAAYCELYFYRGVDVYLKGDRKLAKQLLEKAVATKEYGFIEWPSAQYILENWKF